jgi:hypothetical protein
VPPHPEPHTQAEARHATGGASSMFSGGKTSEEKKTRKWSIIGVVIGVVGLVVVLLIHRSSSAGAAPAATTASTTPGSTLDTSGTVAGYGGGDYAGLQSQLQQLETTLATVASQANPTASTTGTTTGTTSASQTALSYRSVGAGLTLAGGGWTSPETSASGATFSPIESGTAFNAAYTGGQTVYYQPAPGVFQVLPKAVGQGVLNPKSPYANTPTFLAG